MKTTKIEWTESTWNPTTGCTKISSGCKNCYAERMAKRLCAMGIPKYCNGFEVNLHYDVLDEPYSWKNPRVIFVNSMSDLFHEMIPLDYIQQVFHVMNDNPQHTFQVLTKRGDRLAELSDRLEWTKNIWMGVTVESPEYSSRIENLRKADAFVKFLSLEPLINKIEYLDLKEIDWVIVGGESGPGARPLKKEWIELVKDRCHEQAVPFFFKQWGGVNKKKNGRLFEGKTWDEMPFVSAN